jgi:hypothetical protein
MAVEKLVRLHSLYVRFGGRVSAIIVGQDDPLFDCGRVNAKHERPGAAGTVSSTELDIPIIFLTAYPDDAIKARALNEGYLLPPEGPRPPGTAPKLVDCLQEALTGKGRCDNYVVVRLSQEILGRVVMHSKFLIFLVLPVRCECW